MDSKFSSTPQKALLRRLFLPSLAIANFATGPLGVLLGLLLIDIALTFEVSVGVMGQANTLSSIVVVIFALFMGILNVRFGHKHLLMIGLLFVTISALGCYLAFNFDLMLLFFSLSGVGTAMVFPMITTLVGQYIPLEKRGNAMGWIIAAGSLSYLIGAPIIGFLVSIGGWRFILVSFVTPVALASLLLAHISVPRTSDEHQQPEITKETYLKSFRGVLLNKSAAACLVGNVLRTASFVAIVLYGISFFRHRFSVSIDFATAIILGAAACYTVGSLFAGRLVNRFGRKSLTVATTFLAGLFIVSFVFAPDLWLSLGLNFVGTWFSGMGSSASNSLALEQVPKYRGTMMSINSAAIGLGNAFGSAIGGVVLIFLSYEALGSILGAMGVVAATIFLMLSMEYISPESAKT